MINPKETYHVEEWYIPGPTDPRPETLQEMARPPFGHRTEIMEQVVANVRQDMFELVGASAETHHMVLANGSGTTALEIAARSWGDPNAKEPEILVPAIGLFGELWASVFESNGILIDNPRTEDGAITDPNELDALLKDKHYRAVALTHVDTSTGTVNPLEQIAKVVKKHGVLLFVDAVSSVGGINIDVSKLGIDYLVTAPQKALGVPPSLGLAVVSNNALDPYALPNVKRGWETDVLRQAETNARNRTLTTPAQAQIGALALQLDYILRTEGAENRYNRHSFMADLTRDWAADEEFNLLPTMINAADTVTCVVDDREMDLEGIRGYLARMHGYGFDGGHEKLAEKRRVDGKAPTFRIAHMGDRTPEQLESYLDTLSVVMKKFQHFQS